MNELVHLPVPDENAALDREAIRRSLGVSRETVVILMASRMEPWKGHLNLLSAASMLRPQAKWVIWVAGGPQSNKEQRYYDRLQQEVSERWLTSRIKFLGHRNDVPSLLRACDIHCQPNEQPEPFGMVFVEAMRAVVPSVTFAMGGPREIFDDQSGVLVSPGSTEQLTQALTLLIDNAELRLRIGQAALARARELFNPTQQLNRIYSLLAQVARRRQCNPEEKWDSFSVASHS